MPVMQYPNQYTIDDINFAASATGTEIVNLTGRSPIAIVTPASLGATTFTFTSSVTLGGTYYPVNDATGATITVTVSATNGGWADITSIFPASVQFVKLVSGTSMTKTVQLISRNV